MRPFTRRAWAQASLLGMISGRALGFQQSAGQEGVGGGTRAPAAPRGRKASGLKPEELAELELDEARQQLRSISRRAIVSDQTEHFQAIGDASRQFLRLTLDDCEALAGEFLKHYRARGFEVAAPGRRLTLLVLEDARSFRQIAPNLPPVVTGMYKRNENWLVLYDFRNAPRGARPAGYSNISTLAHESTHLFTFNYGLLDRESDTPRAILEGLATYAEEHRVQGGDAPGRLNAIRLDDLAHVQRRVAWIPLETLLSDDQGSFASTIDRVLLAYAQSWLLIYTLMSTPALTPKLVAYLKAIRTRKDQTHRVADARAQLGDLNALDALLKRESIRLQRLR